MRMKRRLTALLVAIMVCISVFPGIALTASAETILFDEAVGLMNAIGVTAKGKITEENENSPISRIDFMIIVSRLLGLNEETSSDNDYFYDIPTDHWAKKTLNSMVENDYITVGDRYFRPDDAIKRAEAAKIIVTALGRQSEAEYKGGYPGGYLSVAENLKLFKGVNPVNEFTYKDAVIFLYNSAMTEITNVNIKADKITFSESKKTLLALYHDIYWGEGVVSAVEGVSVDNTVAPKDGIVIGGETFETDEWYYDYIGMNVKYFYEEKSGDSRKLVFLTNKEKAGSEVITIKSRYYNRYDGNYIYYSENENSATLKKVRVYPGAMIIRNGEKSNTDMMSALDRNNIYGTIRVIDTGKYDGADLIIIESYENIVVSYIDAENKKIYGKDKSVQPLNLNEDDGIFIKYFAADGTETSFSEIVLDNVVSAAVSSDGKCAIVRTSGKTVNGVVSDKGIDDYDEPYINIDGEIYNAESKFYEKNKQSIAVGASVSFGIDAFGNISAFFESKNEDMQYACLINAFISDYANDVTLDRERVILKLYTSGGELISVPCSDKVRIDNQTYSRNDAVIEYFSELGEVQPQGIIFKYDSKGNVKNIDTTFKNPATEGDSTLRRINTADDLYYHWTGLFSNVAYMPADIPLMLVPPMSEIKTADINDFAIKNRSVLTASKTYRMDLLTTDPDSCIPDMAICYHETMPEAADNTALYVVEKLTTALNADDEATTCLTLDNAGDSDYLVSSDYMLRTTGEWDHVDPATLTAGDIVRIGVNIIGEITDIKLVFDYSTALQNSNEEFFINAVNPSYALNENSMVGANYDTVTGYGYVGKKNGTIFEWGYNSPHVTNQLYGSDIQPNSLKVVVFDNKKKKDKCTNGTADDIVSYEESATDFSRIVTMQKDKVLSRIVVYK